MCATLLSARPKSYTVKMMHFDAIMFNRFKVSPKICHSHITSDIRVNKQVYVY